LGSSPNELYCPCRFCHSRNCWNKASRSSARRSTRSPCSARNFAKAHRIAGYKPNRGNASHLRSNESILKRVAELLQERENIHSQATAKAVEAVALTKERDQFARENSVSLLGTSEVLQWPAKRSIGSPCTCERREPWGRQFWRWRRSCRCGG